MLARGTHFAHQSTIAATALFRWWVRRTLRTCFMRKIRWLLDGETDVLFPKSQPLLRQKDRFHLGVETHDRDLAPPGNKERPAQHPPRRTLDVPGRSERSGSVPPGSFG